MATSVIDHPVLPEDANILATGDHLVNLNNLGQAAQERLRLRERRITELELRGEIKPATILNRSPFTLRVESGLIPYTVPPRPKGKPFSTLTITGTRSFPIYRGNQEMSDKSLRGKYDVKVLLPVEQLMEFKHTYIGETKEDRLVKAGGVIIFEGDMEGVTPKSTVRVPEFVFRKGGYPVKRSSPPAPDSKTFIPRLRASSLINSTLRQAGSAIGSSRISTISTALSHMVRAETRTSDNGTFRWAATSRA